MYQPLADLIRPQTLDDVCGQTHILGPNGLLRRIIESGQIPNMIFYGPSGTGKTTIANIIARQTNKTLHRLNATTASIADIKGIIGDIGTMLAPDGVLRHLVAQERPMLLQHAPEQLRRVLRLANIPCTDAGQEE